MIFDDIEFSTCKYAIVTNEIFDEKWDDKTENGILIGTLENCQVFVDFE